jgi:D-3-phosphoglycerate dehydrogenase / 2-oxoglutarate reductase
MLKVLIADKLPDAARTRLQERGIEVVAAPSLKDEALVAALSEHDPDVLVVRSTKVRAEHLNAARALQLVVRAGAGVNNIDLAVASSRGVCVSNCPGMNAAAVAELAMGHLINADRRIADGVSALRDGAWKKKVYAKQAHGLKGRRLAVLGVGSIGAEVIRRARAFDMEVVCWSPSMTARRAEKLGAEYASSALSCVADADALTIHMALNPATRGFVGDGILSAMRPGAIVINTSRGEVIDEVALARHVKTRGLRAGLDVFCNEPSTDGDWSCELAALDGVYGTHHIGASTDQAQDAVVDEALRVIFGWQSTGSAPNCVNLAAETDASHLLVVRHKDEVGVLASVLGTLSRCGINVQGMENVLFSGGHAACARIQVDAAPPAEALVTLAALPPVYDAQLVEL